jgi:hypothetical protein
MRDVDRNPAARVTCWHMMAVIDLHRQHLFLTSFHTFSFLPWRKWGYVLGYPPINFLKPLTTIFRRR